MYFVYILLCNDQTFYIGSTNDLQKRLHSHNFLKSGAKYTRARRPVEVIYQEEFESKSLALKREHFLKQLTRKQKQSLIHAHNKTL